MFYWWQIQHLGHTIPRLVTDIQVKCIYVKYVVEMSFQNWSMLKIKQSYISLYICNVFFKKQWFNILSLRLNLLYMYLLKVYPSLWTSARNQGGSFSYFRHFKQKIVGNQPKNMKKKSILFTVTCHISTTHTGNNFRYVQNQFCWL